jgi:hypothetical protein
MEEKKGLEKISSQLDMISKSLVELNMRVDRLEGKTNDIHQYVPFVGWLEGVGSTLCKWSFFTGIEEPPKVQSNLIKDDK